MKTSSTTTERNASLIRLFLIATLAIAGPAWAIQWDAGGGADTTWHNNLNWAGDALPGAGQSAQIASDVTVTFTPATGVQTIGVLEHGRFGGTSPNLNISGGTLNSSQLLMGMYSLARTATLNLSGGTLNMGSNNQWIGQGATGVLNASGGSLNLPGIVRLGSDFGGSEGTGIMDLSGSSITTAGAVWMDQAGDSTLTIQGNAEATFTSLTMSGSTATSDKILNVSDNASLSVGTLTISNGPGTETFNWTGGTITADAANVDLNGSVFQVGATSTLNLGDNGTHVFADGLTVTTGGTLGTGNNSAETATIDNSAGKVFTLQNGATLDYSIRGSDESSDTFIFTSSLDANFGTAPTSLNLVVDVVGGDVKQTAGPFAIFNFGASVPTGWDSISWNITAADGTRLKSTGSVIVGDGVNGLAVGEIGLSGFEAFSIPEPSTAMLLGMGAAVMILRRRIRR